jgi:predicted ester cyclase
MRKVLTSFCSSMVLLVACNTGTKTETAGSDTTATTTATMSGESKEERNKEVAMESVKAVINKNADEALKNADPNSVDYYDGSGPPTKGLDSIKAGMKTWLASMQDYKGENLQAVADGNTVMVYGDWSGTFKSDFMGMKTAGKKFKGKDVDIFTFNDDGKITEHRSVQSMAGMLAQQSSASK